MKGKAIPFLVLAGLSIATCAMALDTQKRPMMTTQPEGTGFRVDALFQCDDNVTNNAYFQDPNGRYGNVFSFPAGSRLTNVVFVHFGYGFAGPYAYDIEVWDATSCTYFGGRNGLSAANAAAAFRTETVDLCAQNLVVSGDYAVTVDANSCAAPDDCYPDVMWDDQLFVACPVIIDAIGGVCIDVSDQSGPFLLRVNTNNCPVPTIPSSWGNVKTLYR